MNKFLILMIFMMFSSMVFAKDIPVMLKVKANFNLGANVIDTFRSGAEDSLTTQEYVLISKQQQEAALKEQAEQRNSDCYDDSCLVDTGKMMAAQVIFIIEITKMENEYVFKARLVDLETGATKRTVTKVYKGRLTSASDLLKFAKELTSNAIKLRKDETIKKYSNIVSADLIKIIVSTNPMGAKIYIDGKFIGKSPAQAHISKGEHKFKITLKNYEDYIFKKELYMDKEEKINLKVKYYDVLIKTEPSNANVFHNGSYIGESSVTMRLSELNYNDLEKSSIIKATKEGYYDKTLSIKMSKLKNTPQLNIKLDKIPVNSILLTLNTENAKLEVKTGSCSFVEKSSLEYIIKDFESNSCSIKLMKEYFFTKHIELDFKKKSKLNVKLKELEKYKVKLKVNPSDAKAIFVNQKTKDETILDSGFTKELYKGIYRYSLIRDGYIMNPKTNNEIILSNNIMVENYMIPNYVNAMRHYAGSNINLGKDLLYLSFVLGVDFFQLVSGNDIKSFGASFNHNVTDSYNYFDVYINWKFTPYKGLSLGTELSFVIGSDFITVMWGLVADYNYFITKDFFVNVKIESGINFFNQNSSNLGENLYFIGGVFVGWNGF